MKTWTYRLSMHPLAAARAGCLARITAIFADRGLSLDRVHAGLIDGQPRIDLGFQADEAAAEAVRRRLLRLPDVRDIVVTE